MLAADMFYMFCRMFGNEWRQPLQKENGSVSGIRWTTRGQLAKTAVAPIGLARAFRPWASSGALQALETA